jgi:hypothetical protein
MVMVETVGSRVSATHRLSMLKPLPLKSPATRVKTPNSFSTKRVMTCRIKILIGIMEYWNDGMMGQNNTEKPILPIFH